MLWLQLVSYTTTECRSKSLADFDLAILALLSV